MHGVLWIWGEENAAELESRIGQRVVGRRLERVKVDLGPECYSDALAQYSLVLGDAEGEVAQASLSVRGDSRWTGAQAHVVVRNAEGFPVNRYRCDMSQDLDAFRAKYVGSRSFSTERWRHAAPETKGEMVADLMRVGRWGGTFEDRLVELGEPDAFELDLYYSVESVVEGSIYRYLVIEVDETGVIRAVRLSRY